MLSPGRDSDQSRPPRRSCYHSARMSESHSFILTVVCPDAVGIVAAVAGYLTAQQYFIEESTHFWAAAWMSTCAFGLMSSADAK